MKYERPNIILVLYEKKDVITVSPDDEILIPTPGDDNQDGDIDYP